MSTTKKRRTPKSTLKGIPEVKLSKKSIAMIEKATAGEPKRTRHSKKKASPDPRPFTQGNLPGGYDPKKRTAW
jgi:hypothetical protein